MVSAVIQRQTIMHYALSIMTCFSLSAANYALLDDTEKANFFFITKVMIA